MRALIPILGPLARQRARRQLKATFRQAECCSATQWRTLQRVLQLNADSDFSRDRRLGQVGSIARFRRLIPVSDYELVADAINQARNGRPQALLGSRNPLLMFALTSGTCSEPKSIPVTGPFLRDYRRGWQDWGIQALDDHPVLYKSSIFQLTTSFDQQRTPGGTPCGSISGLVAHIQNPLIRSLYAVPAVSMTIADPARRMYFSLLQGLRRRDMGMITAANPSTVLQLIRLLTEQSERLTRDLWEGGEPAEDESQIPAVYYRPDRARARELDQLLETQGTLRPRDVWPDLALLAVWTGGSVAAYLPLLRQQLGDLPFRDHGLHASEGRMTIPLEDETSSGLLDVSAHFFEFIPEEELESDQPVVLNAHELTPGGKYEILLTTASGLYRYRIRDVVECTGHYGTTPMLRFLHKGAHVCSLTGEKLTEWQVVQSVSRALDDLPLALGSFALFPVWDDPPGYRLALERDAVEGSLETAHRLTDRVDRQLMQINCEYQEKRRSGRLRPVRATLLPNGAWEKFGAARRARTNASSEQYKHPFLIARFGFLDELRGMVGRDNVLQQAAGR